MSIAFEEFRSQIAFSLFNRLIQTGVSGYELAEQNRANSALLEALINWYFYDGKILSPRTVSHFPATCEPKVRKILGVSPRAVLTGMQKRFLYFEIPGANHTSASNDFGSRCNARFLDRAMEPIESPLAEIYGDEMSACVAVISPYGAQVKLYKAKFAELRKSGWKREQIHQVFTADSEIGREYDHDFLTPSTLTARAAVRAF